MYTPPYLLRVTDPTKAILYKEGSEESNKNPGPTILSKAKNKTLQTGKFLKNQLSFIFKKLHFEAITMNSMPFLTRS